MENNRFVDSYFVRKIRQNRNPSPKNDETPALRQAISTVSMTCDRCDRQKIPAMPSNRSITDDDWLYGIHSRISKRLKSKIKLALRVYLRLI
jgi:hypothetical protein